jgi:hypothetical protein
MYRLCATPGKLGAALVEIERLAPDACVVNVIRGELSVAFDNVPAGHPFRAVDDGPAIQAALANVPEGEDDAGPTEYEAERMRIIFPNLPLESARIIAAANFFARYDEYSTAYLQAV